MENVEMGTFLDSEIASLCNIFTLEQPNFVDEFLGHSTPFVDKNEYIYDDPSNFLPLTNQNHFSFHYDSISNTEFSDNASDSTTYNNPSQTTIDSHQNSHFSSPSDAFFPMMNQENNALLSPDFLTEINVDSFPSFHEGNLEDNTSHNLGSPSETEVPLKRKHNNTLASNDEENQKVAAPKKRSRVSKDRGNNCIEAMNYNTENHIDAGEVENSDDGGSKFSEQASEGDNSSLKEISKGKKKRASRGEATDPQSLYARRRRERINERLRILQQLVPNGTKVDISTMLEQALHYVKFLQLQIRILSSDDLWMYAPMAYNGVDLSLYKRISPFLLP